MVDESKGVSVIMIFLAEQKIKAEKKLIEAEKNVEKYEKEVRFLRKGIEDINRTIAFINEGQSKEKQDSLKKGKQSVNVKKPVVSDKILNRSIGKIGLTARTVNALNEYDIISVGQLIALTPSLLLKIKGIGNKAVKMIKRSLWELGLKLKD